jgi:hypothetical protein
MTLQADVPYTFFRRIVDGQLAAVIAGGALDGDMVERWWKPLADAGSRGRFFAMKTAVLAAGTVA